MEGCLRLKAGELRSLSFSSFFGGGTTHIPVKIAPILQGGKLHFFTPKMGKSGGKD